MTNRKILLGPNQPAIDEYHSQCALSFNSLLINAVQKKINRAKLGYKDVSRIQSNSDQKWDELIYTLHSFVRENLSYDEYALDAYIREHSTSTIIPGTKNTKSRKWSQLQPEGKQHLYNLVDAYLEDLITNWDEMKMKILQPKAVGRGIRGKSPPIPGIQINYSLEFVESRQVAFIPFLSSWFAFMSDSNKLKMWTLVRDFAADKFGADVLLPPLEKGAYWFKVRQAIERGDTYLTGDGSNWETYSALMTQVFAEAVDDGIPQYMSGAAMTSINATVALLRMCETILPRGGIHTIGALGDDLLVTGTQSGIKGIKNLPGIWEIDEVGTRNKIALGMVMLPDYKGTFPGLSRISIDRADKKESFTIGDEVLGIEGSIPSDSFTIYREIMEHGTLHEEPLVAAIAKKELEEFWKLWRSDREGLLSQLGDVEFEVLPEDYSVDD
jgi:hypothetical protein